jgi:hypothetical protein
MADRGMANRTLNDADAAMLVCERRPETLADFRKPAVVVGHPGHELLAFGFLTRYRPLTHMITDGSGIGNPPRVEASARVLRDLDVPMGELFGIVADTAIYEAALRGRTDVFVDMRDRLVASFVAHDIDVVLSDAAEGFNPTHDICRYIVDAAVAMAVARSGRSIAAFELKLTHWALGEPEVHDERCLHFRLSDALFASKLATANQQVALTNEIREAIAALGEDYFRTECFREVGPWLELQEKPYYEQVGEMRAARGDFPDVLRFEEHVRPIAAALWRS